MIECILENQIKKFVKSKEEGRLIKELFVRPEEIEEKGVLVQQREKTMPDNEPFPFVVVFGYTIGDSYKNKEGLRAIKCKSVPDEEKDKVTEILMKRGLIGPVYWR